MKSIASVVAPRCGRVRRRRPREICTRRAAARSAACAPASPRRPPVAWRRTRRFSSHPDDDWERRDWCRNVLRVGQDYTLKQGESGARSHRRLQPRRHRGQRAGRRHRRPRHVRSSQHRRHRWLAPRRWGQRDRAAGRSRPSRSRRDRRRARRAAGLRAGPQHFAIGATPLADRVRSIVPWITEGLLLGRPIVPRLSWVWLIVLFVFLLSLALNLLFIDTVRMCADAIAARPFTTFLVGLLVLLLTGPVSVILAASVIGILVVPFVLCAVVIAWIIGKVGVSMRLGDSMIGQTSPASRAAIGPVVRHRVRGDYLAYMVPVLGFMAWGLVGVTGLGAASLAFLGLPARESRTAQADATTASAAPRPPDSVVRCVASVTASVTADDVRPAPSPPNGAATGRVRPGRRGNEPARLPESRFLRTRRGVCARHDLRPHHLRDLRPPGRHAGTVYLHDARSTTSASGRGRAPRSAASSASSASSGSTARRCGPSTPSSEASRAFSPSLSPGLAACGFSRTRTVRPGTTRSPAPMWSPCRGTGRCRIDRNHSCETPSG